jgi:hypothetical protein
MLTPFALSFFGEAASMASFWSLIIRSISDLASSFVGSKAYARLNAR